MKLGITWQQAALAAGGTLHSGHPEEIFDSFVIDSRLADKNSAFWVISGKNHDAHKFLPDVLARGTTGAIVQKGRATDFLAKFRHIIEVEDTYLALHKLAAWHRNRWDIPVAAVTGSNGKSSTKEMLRAIFSAKGTTCANKGNLNNQYGLPLSLLELGPEHRYAVFEMGASRKGDIREIGLLASPKAGIITNVSPSHLEFFGDMETIYQTKTEMAGVLAPGGTLVYNSDDKMLARLKTEWKGSAITFGYGEDTDIRPEDSDKLVLVHKGIRHDIQLVLGERHNRLNAAGAAGAALACGLDWDTISKGLANYKPLPMRLQIERRGETTFILDAYNANPASIRAGVETLLKPSYRGPKIAVLGDMKELGKYSEKYHSELGAWLATLPLDRIFLAGPEMKYCHEALTAAGGKAVWSADFNTWTKELSAAAANGGTCLIKASRAMGFEKIMEKI